MSPDATTLWTPAPPRLVVQEGAPLVLRLRMALDVKLDALERWLSPTELQRARGFSAPGAAARFALVRAGLRMALGQCLGCAPREVALVYGHNGKPALTSAQGSDLQFNVSHSGGMGLIVLVHGLETGIDVEAENPKRDLAAVAARVFTEQETRLVAGGGEETFYALWSAKEACLKAVGGGLGSRLNQWHVGMPSAAWSSVDAPDGQALQLTRLDVGAGYSAALAVVADTAPAPPVCLDFSGSISAVISSGV